MNRSEARTTAIDLRNTLDAANDAVSARHLPEGLANILLDIKAFATEAGELDVNRPDSNTAYFQADMARIWSLADTALRDTRIVGSTTTHERDDSQQADNNRDRRKNVAWATAWIIHTLTECVKAD